MSYLYRRGKGAKRRVMHLSAHDRHGNIRSTLCGRMDFNTSINVPLGQPVCKNCRKEAARNE